MPNKSWFQARLKDPFLLKARRENYRSRAAYKLQEINEKYRLIKPGQSLLDLGAAPGSWTQIALEILRGKGKIIGVDLLDIDPIENAILLKGDIRDLQIQNEIRKLCPQGFDTIISDMAPNTTGVHHADTANSAELVSLVLELCPIFLKPGGSLAAKVFEGGEYKELHSKVKSMFGFAKSFNPKASLSKSREVYIVAMNFQNKQS